MIGRPRTFGAALLVASLVLAACTGGEPDDPPTTDPTQGATTSAPSPTDDDTSPDAPRPTSAMTIEDVAPPMSSAEIRVAEIIVERRGHRRGHGRSRSRSCSTSTRPTCSASDALDDIAEVLAFYEDAPVVIAGHTDSRGSDDYNRELSQDRADAVFDALVDREIASSRMTAEGRGATQPVAPNENDDGSDNPEGRAQNRRVEVLVVGVEPPEPDS